MGTMPRDSIIKNVLKNLCCSYGWSYGVFWSFDQPNSLFFTVQDAYYEENQEGLIENLRLQVPMLGAGIIGQAAFTKKHQWMSIENANTRQASSISIGDMFMDYSEFNCQFSSRIKTIAAIPVESQGVVQFGSTEKIMETEEFVYQTKTMFQEIVNIQVLEIAPCSSINSPGSRTLESWNPFPIQSNSSLPFINNQQDLFDSLPDFGIPDEILQTGDFDIPQLWIPPSNNDLGLTIPVNDYTTLGPMNGLFSKLGIEEFLEGISGTSNVTMTGEKLSSVTKRRKTGNLLEPQMAIKKKAKPGTRPRPKDRQQILDRMAELRELIPNGDKMSIDCLLDRTVKHLLFLESVTKHADRVKHADETKKKKDKNSRSNGATWACELANQTMVCPLIVENLGTPGQMLIEMLCEENGFFLEMVDVIRGFGVTILKGVMEVRDKIWARFIVETEANRHVTRHEIFSALVQLLQVTCINDNQLRNKVMENGNLLLDNDYCVDL